LLILLVAISGCATTPRMVTTGAETRATWQSQSSGGGRTTKVGLPLTRAQKIGLWSGVAVLIAYLMADDDADDSAAVDGP
jgi:Flp pilus assembly protein TadD